MQSLIDVCFTIQIIIKLKKETYIPFMAENVSL